MREERNGGCRLTLELERWISKKSAYAAFRAVRKTDRSALDGLADPETQWSRVTLLS